MKAVFRLFCTMAFGSALCIPALAATNAQLLQEACQADDRLDTARAANDYSHLKSIDSERSTFCLGFIEGWAQTIDNLAIFEANADSTWFSFPTVFNFKQGKKVFLQYVADHPERLDQPAAFVLRMALSEKNILQSHSIPLGKTCGIEVIPPVPGKK
jgi:hypothetical protein